MSERHHSRKRRRPRGLAGASPAHEASSAPTRSPVDLLPGGRPSEERFAELAELFQAMIARAEGCSVYERAMVMAWAFQEALAIETRPATNQPQPGR